MTTETAALDHTLLDGECQCEYGHYGVAPCSLTVTHRVHSCAQDGFNVCRTAVAVVRDRLARDQCTDCGCTAAECWIIRPV
jgi:hypothetical protein